MKKALVITPTTGASVLKDAIQSVQFQNYENLEHLVVIDGEKFTKNANAILNQFKKIKVATVPYNTGGEGFYGHRIMAAFSHLVPHDYILFLDQDNWFEYNHVKSLIEEIESFNFEWAYSLRNIYDENKNFICKIGRAHV